MGRPWSCKRRAAQQRPPIRQDQWVVFTITRNLCTNVSGIFILVEPGMLGKAGKFFRDGKREIFVKPPWLLAGLTDDKISVRVKRAWIKPADLEMIAAHTLAH